MTAVFDTGLFFYHKETKTFSTDFSVLSHHAGQVFHRFNRFDHGFELKSHKTGKTAEFIVENTDVREGEIQGWHLKPSKTALARNPALAGVKILVVNT